MHQPNKKWNLSELNVQTQRHFEAFVAYHDIADLDFLYVGDTKFFHQVHIKLVQILNRKERVNNISFIYWL